MQNNLYNYITFSLKMQAFQGTMRLKVKSFHNSLDDMKQITLQQNHFGSRIRGRQPCAEPLNPCLAQRR